MDVYQFGEAQRQLYDCVWGEFCDWYIELTKNRIGADEAVSPLPVLVHVLETSLRLLHPYMPFITEELWQHLKIRLPVDWQPTESIMVTSYPTTDDSAADPEAERIMEAVIEIVRSIRNVRAEHKVEPARWVEARVYSGELTAALAAYSASIEALGRASPVSFQENRPTSETGDNALVMVLKEAEVVIPMESMVDVAAERKRLDKEIEQVDVELARLEARLNDKAFLSKAPETVVEKERGRLAERKDRVERLRQELARLA